MPPDLEMSGAAAGASTANLVLEYQRPGSGWIGRKRASGVWVVQPLSAARDWARTSTRPSLVWRAWTRTSIWLSAWLSEVAKSNRTTPLSRTAARTSASASAPAVRA